MKVLFTVGGSRASVFGAAPLATAARNAGHEILLAADEPMLDAATAIGLPAVSVSPEPIRYGRDVTMASARLDALLDLAEDWAPDLVVGDLSYVAGLLATRLKVPYVRQSWIPEADMDRRAEEELRPELERMGLPGLPVPDLFIDVCPPSLRPPNAPHSHSMRWIPGYRQRPLEPWMYTRPKGRQRVLITSGTRTLTLGIRGSSMRYLLDDLALAGAEVLIAAPESAAEQFDTDLGDVRIGWIPVDVVASTCDLAVHHGGATTAMTVTNAGVPQLIIPDSGCGTAVAQALSGFGAAVMVEQLQDAPGYDPGEVIASNCLEILSTPRYTERAWALATEIGTLPTPCEVVHTLETLTAP